VKLGSDLVGMDRLDLGPIEAEGPSHQPDSIRHDPKRGSGLLRDVNDEYK
jgi:hypothetical protein